VVAAAADGAQQRLRARLADAVAAEVEVRQRRVPLRQHARQLSRAVVADRIVAEVERRQRVVDVRQHVRELGRDEEAEAVACGGGEQAGGAR